MKETNQYNTFEVTWSCNCDHSAGGPDCVSGPASAPSGIPPDEVVASPT